MTVTEDFFLLKVDAFYKLGEGMPYDFFLSCFLTIHFYDYKSMKLMDVLNKN